MQVLTNLLAGVTYYELAQAPVGNATDPYEQEPISIGYFACSMAIWAASPLLPFLFLYCCCGCGVMCCPCCLNNDVVDEDEDLEYGDYLKGFMALGVCQLIWIPILYVVSLFVIHLWIPLYTILCASRYLIFSDEHSAKMLRRRIPQLKMLEQVTFQLTMTKKCFNASRLNSNLNLTRY